jgi:hypothetical protein
MISGALSGITNNIAVYPLDLVREKKKGYKFRAMMFHGTLAC